MSGGAAATEASGVRGDRPLDEDGIDLLGFRDMAEQLANALIDRASKDGIVVGIEGEWGSGKSSLLALTTRALSQIAKERRPAVLSFRPWLIGNRDALLTSLFDDLARTVDAMRLVEGDATGTTATGIKDLSRSLRKYGRRLGALAPLASLASMAGIPWADKLAGALSHAKEFFKEKDERPLADIKKNIDNALARLPRRVIVMIDDVDRLEPTEIAEVLRLVRSVADFQNVVYVLCYDHFIVSQAIQTAMQLSNGGSYLEKIVQIAVRVPAPEPFALRQMFSRGLSEFAQPANEDGERRLAALIDQEGGNRLKTPRAVNRALDALRFIWPALRDKVDLADLVWLQLIRLNNPALYAWIEEYVASMAAVGSGRAMVQEEARATSFTKLTTALETDGVTFEEARWRFHDYLPGISKGFLEGNDHVPIYETVTEQQRLTAIAEMRLASPDHHRLYFALALPAGAARETDYLALWEVADAGREEVKILLQAWLADPTSGIGTRLEMMLDRLRGVPPEGLNGPRSHNILLALADVLDHPLAMGRDTGWGGPTSWREAEYLLPILRQRMGDQARPATLQAFEQGEAIGWLVQVFRTETFAHGKFGDRRRDEKEWILSDQEYDEVVQIMHGRFTAMTMADILAAPDPMSLLFAWNQSGGADEARAVVEAATRTDTELLNALDKMASTVRSSEGEYLVIRRESLIEFLDPDAAYARVVAISEGGNELAAKANTIRSRFERARDF